MSLASKMYYSEKYYDEEYEYRHVVIPKELVKVMPKGRLMDETEWRGLGIQQSPGWIHYMIHLPEPHVVMFRRAISQAQVAQLRAEGLLPGVQDTSSNKEPVAA